MDKVIKLIVKGCSFTKAGQVMDCIVGLLDNLTEEKLVLEVEVNADLYKVVIKKQTSDIKITITPSKTFDEVISAVDESLQH